MESCVMVVAAHPDDAEIGMGGTVAKLTAEGVPVVVCDLTNGEPTPHGSPEIRAQETLRASEILGLKKRVTLDIPNREIFDTVDNRKKLASVMREAKPDVVFLPYMQDAHPDHIQASALTLAARFYSKFVKTDIPHTPHFPRKLIYYFALHMRAKVTPSFIFDISSTFAKKLDAVRAYESQFVKHPANFSMFESLRLENAYWGAQVGCEFGEAFFSPEQLKIKSVESLLEI